MWGITQLAYMKVCQIPGHYTQAYLTERVRRTGDMNLLWTATLSHAELTRSLRIVKKTWIK